MAVLKLPNDIQSIFSASSQICNYKRAVEELVYNSLDADSTSIAIRVNIEKNTIQVIDNGNGVSKRNFDLIGQRHATSKFVDLSTLKSVPHKYGYRGQSLASIIEVSKSVKISSRCQDAEETWSKSFHKGKEQKLMQASQRPTKGTTIDISGFLYNLKIQKRAIDSLNELNEIKSFLEQLSLVHNNISLSLRDDARNEIVFKLHKNRDIYQTLSSMFDINRADVQELKVEKNQYKITAYIGKRDTEPTLKQWVYLNGRLLQNSKVNKIINDHLKKSLKLNGQNKKNHKSKNPYNQEDELNKNGMPFYFIFITCPYYDYDVTYRSKQTDVEFKEWEPVKKLIEKMAQFYVGDIKLKEVRKTKNPAINQQNQQKTDDTRDQVKKIMDKILGSNPRKIGVSQMQNGIKGKIMKRKSKKKSEKMSSLKIQPNENTKAKKNEMQIPLMKDIQDNKMETFNTSTNENNNLNIIKENTGEENKTETRNQSHTLFKEKKHDKNKEKNQIRENHIHKMKEKIKNRKTVSKAVNKKATHVKKSKLEKIIHLNKPKKHTKNLPTPKQKFKNVQKRADKCKKDSILKRFKEDPTGSVKKRCNVLTRKVDNLLDYMKKRKRKIFVNETVHYSNIVRNNKKYSIRKKVGEIVIHDYIPKPISTNPCTYDDRVWEKRKKKTYKSSYDLIQTILRTQETKNSYANEVNIPNSMLSPEKSNISTNINLDYSKYDDASHVPILPKLTYESHNYENFNLLSHNNDQENNEREILNKEFAKTRFITTQSKDNFVIPRDRRQSRKGTRTALIQGKGIQNKINQLFANNFDRGDESPYTIEFSIDNKHNSLCKKDKRIQQSPSAYNETQNDNRTITIIDLNEGTRDKFYSQNCCTYTINENTHNKSIRYEKSQTSEYNENEDYIEDSTEKFPYGRALQREPYSFNTEQNCEQQNMNVVFISNSQRQLNGNEDIQIQRSCDKELNALDICETVLSQNDVKEQEINQTERNDSLFNDEFMMNNEFLYNQNIYNERAILDPNDAKEYIDEAAWNHQEPEHVDFTSTGEMELLNIAYDYTQDIFSNHVQIANAVFPDGEKSVPDDKLHRDKRDTDTFNFNFQNRHRFVPKGMSPIFANCQSKAVCDYNLEKEYYEQTIYNKFANNIQLNTDMFEPDIQNVKDFTTKAIEKVNNKLNKDNASLIFNSKSLEQVKVLRQIDNKFIAARIVGKAQQTSEMVEYLVLFDQHAVHERIRLENNMSEYFDGNQWKSTSLDDLQIKLSKDEILYLHNYREKFIQLGLQWSMSNNEEVVISAIPEAILGKNPRQVEIVMKATKNLIMEEVNAIRSQSGCISLYPISIMDLVFSEACRYAIKFGDPLSKTECVDLLNSLSKCKTPFQCAHGRPVMAVLMEIQEEARKYKVNMTSIHKWTKLRKR